MGLFPRIGWRVFPLGCLLVVLDSGWRGKGLKEGQGLLTTLHHMETRSGPSSHQILVIHIPDNTPDNIPGQQPLVEVSLLFVAVFILSTAMSVFIPLLFLQHKHNLPQSVVSGHFE